MKKIFQLFLITALVYGAWGCSRSDLGDSDVSANSEEARRDDNIVENRDYTAPSAPTEAPAPPATTRNDRVERNEPVTKERTATEPERSNRTSSATRAEPETRTERAPAIAESRPRAVDATPQRTMVTVPEGTTLTVALLDPVSTETSEPGDTFTATLAEPLTIDGSVVADKGTRVQGTVAKVMEPGKVKGRASIELKLTGIMDGSRTIRVSTQPFTAMAEDNKDRDAGIIAGGAGVGAIIGGIAGGKKGAAIGAILGGGSGTAAVLATRGEHLALDPETRVNFVLADSLRLPVIRKAT